MKILYENRIEEIVIPDFISSFQRKLESTASVEAASCFQQDQVLLVEGTTSW